ncbi:TOMM precursor leader peptide-binding protein [Streptacidiphilus melanogenes]|uniref:TOMM precursor leader peptide-binding protein n=1 Tax=Streptacidiphilus melanogenes TaxID=411235 RepID=UPI0005AAA731|nr:TOMM precursor leader peptide-binding protein [Streptacidiphilus melanogenes]
MKKLAAAYEDLAPTRPRLRRDVLFTETPTGVLFHNAQGGFGVNATSAYRFASLVVPHLDGRQSVAALCEGLGDGARRMLVHLVDALYTHGFARDVAADRVCGEAPPAPVAARFEAQLGYLDHYADDPAGRFQRFRRSRVAVLGDGPAARWCALGLLRNGSAAIGVAHAAGDWDELLPTVLSEAAALTADDCPAAVELSAAFGSGRVGWAELDGYDLVVVAPGPDAARQTATLLDAGVPTGRALLPAWSFGGRLVAGPLMRAGSQGCWMCALLRLGANGDAAAAAEVWSGLGLVAPLDLLGPRLGGPLAAMVGNLLGFEVFRITTGALPAETEDRLVVQDLDTLDVVTERLLPQPRCPYCAVAGDPPANVTPEAGRQTAGEAASVDESELAEPDLVPDPVSVLQEAGRTRASQALESLEPLLGSHAGVFRGFEDEEFEQSPLKVSSVAVGLGPGWTRRIAAFDLHHVAGARLNALLRAAEVYADHVVPHHGDRREGAAAPDPAAPGAATAATAAGWPVVGPEALDIGSGVATGAGRVRSWARVRSLLGGGTVLVPSAVLRPFGADNGDRLVERTSAGIGAGRTPGQAVARGLLTALSHQAVRQAVRGAVPVFRHTPESLDGVAELRFLLRSAAHLGAQPELLELGEPGERPVPVLLARCAAPSGGQALWAVSASPDRHQAAVRALRDLVGALQLRLAGTDQVDTGDPLMADLDPAALAVTTAAPTAPQPAQGTAAPFTETLARIRKSGQDVLVAQVAAPDLAVGGVHVARVLLARGVAR